MLSSTKKAFLSLKQQGQPTEELIISKQTRTQLGWGFDGVLLKLNLALLALFHGSPRPFSCKLGLWFPKSIRLREIQFCSSEFMALLFYFLLPSPSNVANVFKERSVMWVRLFFLSQPPKRKEFCWFLCFPEMVFCHGSGPDFHF